MHQLNSRSACISANSSRSFCICILYASEISIVAVPPLDHNTTISKSSNDADLIVNSRILLLGHAPQRMGVLLPVVVGTTLCYLGSSWGHLGRLWGLLGRLGGHLGAILGPSWVILGHLGAILGPYWAISGSSWVYLDQFQDYDFRGRALQHHFLVSSSSLGAIVGLH